VKSRWAFALSLAIGLTLSPGFAMAQWAPLGVAVCGSACLPDRPRVLIDGAGGAFIAWRDLRVYPLTDTDVYAQRVTSAGTIAPGWSSDGVPVCIALNSQTLTTIATDGEGGMLIVWIDFRDGALTSADIYAQRIRGDGTIAPGWAVDGVPATRAPDYQEYPDIAPDGTGGAYVAWLDWRNYATHDLDVYAQHLLADGTIASGWPPNGLPVCTESHFQGDSHMLADGSGGVLVVWSDERTGGCDLYAQHLLADGTIAPGWSPDGVPLILGRTRAHLAPDGAGGFYLGCTTDYGGFDQDLYLQRFSFTGTRSPGWPEGGVKLCSAPKVRAWVPMVPDGLGGVLLAWYDYRPSPSGASEIYALRVRSDGSLAPGWTVNGTRVSEDTASDNEFDPSIGPDGVGGAYIAW